MTKVWEIQVEGPLAPFAAGLEESLVGQGYSKNWALQLMALAAEVSHWLQRRGLGVNDLSEEVIDQFFAEREPGRSRCRTVRSMRSITAQLRLLGVMVADRTVAVGRTDVEEELLDSYRRWCVSQRGLTSGTADSYVDYVATFLVLWRPVSDVVVAELDGRVVLDTIRGAGESMASPSLRCLVTALRSFLRFLHATGRTRTSLVSAVPALKCWPRTTLASTLSPGDVRRLVDCQPSRNSLVLGFSRHVIP